MATGIFGRGRCLAIAAAALIAGCTADSMQRQGQAASATQRQCFLPSHVSSFHPIDHDTVRVDVGASDVYELDFAGVCPEVNWSLQVGIRSTRGTSWVCRGYDAELLVPSVSRSGVDRCPVTDVRRLSPAEVEAERARRRS